MTKRELLVAIDELVHEKTQEFLKANLGENVSDEIWESKGKEIWEEVIKSLENPYK